MPSRAKQVDRAAAILPPIPKELVFYYYSCDYVKNQVLNPWITG